ncbi:response regulator transcription factor [Dyadobacter frigoris]|uniref:Response regulator transcription factor n=1 Tax=Dyadobacter frigoris TaxID=2576211 RepID=A0A4U6CPK2_9BACT|nr:response regulator transcription factor [Dyadobacter frigoris]TKT85317.1 response regulator transcription factor [Dyadobacter frigoris]GLU56952.1 DNA-binding response regulator [Dyadobacter frigoris]
MEILIIEDHPIIRAGLKQLISEIAPKAIVTETDNFPEGMRILEHKKFKLLILDIELPGGENIKMMAQAKKRQPDVIILIHSGHDESVYALPYLQAGADGFLSKQAPVNEFHLAFNSLLNNGKYVSHRVQQTILNNISERSGSKLKNPISSLSHQEMLVMELLIEGKWTKEISSIMKLKENTISTYKKRIFDKLRVSDELELAKKVALLKGGI